MLSVQNVLLGCRQVFGDKHRMTPAFNQLTSYLEGKNPTKTQVNLKVTKYPVISTAATGGMDFGN